MRAFFEELNRRRVVRVAAVYAAAAFVVWQAADIAFPALHLPPWLVTAVVALSILGFPIALVLAWAFDVTPDGVVRTDAADARGDEPHVVVSRATLRTHRIAAIGGVLVLAFAGGAFVVFNSSPGRGGEVGGNRDRSIAVLPFANLSADAENEYFSDGITDDILSQLAKIADLKVISRSSVMAYRGVNRPIREIGAELGVAHVLEGSVRRDGSRVRIVAQLSEAHTDRHLWAETYDRELTGIFEIQSEIAQQIVRALQARLSPAEQTRIATVAAADPAAYDLYLQAREYRQRENEEGRRAAITLLREVLRIDPHFAPAYALLARSYLPLRILTQAELDSAMLFAHRAVELAPDLTDGHLALGNALRRAGRSGESAAPYRRGYELSPNDVDALTGLGWVYLGEGRFDEALRLRMRAVALDPTAGSRHRQVGVAWEHLGELERAEAAYAQAARLSPEVWFFHQDLVRMHLRRGDEAAARTRLAVMQSVAPGDADMWQATGEAERLLGDTTAAIRHFERARTDNAAVLPPFPLGLIYWRRGEREKAEAIFGEYERAAAATLDETDSNAGLAYRLAVIHALRGDADAAVHWLEAAMRRGLSASLLETIPLPDVIMADPRVRRTVADLFAERERQRQRVLREGWR
jgi:adenylate cyclase